MMNLLYKIFIWISGIDSTLLKDCPESEHKKYALQGGLIIIPTIMAFVSMMYATSLLTNDIVIRIILTLIWTGFIFIIDRYIVSTFVKNENGKDWLSIQFFIRIIFAIGLGVVISHPVIIRIFDDKIQETQAVIWVNIVDSAEVHSQIATDLKNRPFQNRLDSLTAEADNIRKVISAEIVGANTIIGGYYVSDKPGSGIRVNKLKNDTILLGNEIRELKNKIKINEDSAIVQLDSLIKIRKESLAKGYWAKDDALKTYLDKSNKWDRYWFILAFFVFIDVTAVLLKVFTKYGELDIKYAERQKNRIEQKLYFLKKLLEKKKHYINKDYEWATNKINKIYEDNSSRNYTEIQEILKNAGFPYEDDDITDIKHKNLIYPLIQNVKELSKIKFFYFLAIASIIIGVVISYKSFDTNNQTSTIKVAISSVMFQIIATVVGGLVLHLFTNKKTKKNE